MKKRHLAQLTACGVVAVVLGLATFYAYLNGYFTPPTPAQQRAVELNRLALVVRNWKRLPAEEQATELPNLARALDCRGDDLRREITQLLSNAGAPVVPELIVVLQSPEPHARAAAATVLGNLGEKAVPAFEPLLAALKDPVPTVRTRAVVALGQLHTRGSEAIPALIRAFADADGDVRAAAPPALARFGKEATPPLRGALKDSASDIARQALATLVLLGPDAADALPDLVPLLTDAGHGLQTESAEALVAIGPAALPSLALALDQQDSLVRRVVVQALARMGASAVPLLERGSRDPDPIVRTHALAGLANAGADGIPALLATTRDTDALIRQEAVRLLARAPGSDPKVVAALVALLKDTDESVRAQAIQTLRAIRPEPESTLTLVKPLLDDPGKPYRLHTLRQLAVGPAPLPVLAAGLRELGKRLLSDSAKPVRLATLQYVASLGETAVPVLAAGLRDRDDDYRKLSVQLLAGMPGDSKALYAVLVPLLHDDDPLVRQEAVLVLQRCGPPAIPHLLAALTDASPLLRQQAVWAIYQTRGRTPEVREALLKALKDPDAGVRGRAALAVTPFGVLVLPALSEALQDKEPSVRANAVAALPFLKADARVVLPLILQTQHDDDPLVRVAAIPALETFGEKGLSALLAALKDGDDRVWRKAVDTLGTTTAIPDKTLMPILMAAFKDENAAVRQGVVYVMDRFGGEAVPLLAQALQDRDRQVCFAAVLTLGNIGPMGRVTIPTLAELATTHPEPKLRKAALVAMLLLQDLDRFRADPPQAVPSLGYRLKSEDPILRYHAALTLGVLGPAARGALPTLEEATRDTDGKVAEAARAALVRVRTAS